MYTLMICAVKQQEIIFIKNAEHENKKKDMY